MSGVKISALPAIVTPALSDLFATVQSGTTYKVTGTQLVSLFSSNLSANSVTNANLAQMGAYTIKGNNTNATADPQDIDAGQYPATHTNDSASAGNVGEYINSVVLIGSAVAMTSTVPVDITSISLTAGDWDVWGSFWTAPAVTTTTQGMASWISTVSATEPTPPNEGAFTQLSVSSIAGAANGFPVGQKRISLSGTTTVYLSGVVTFAVSTMGGYGFIGARRIR
jgi:hypothetical protein